MWCFRCHSESKAIAAECGNLCLKVQNSTCIKRLNRSLGSNKFLGFHALPLSMCLLSPRQVSRMPRRKGHLFPMWLLYIPDAWYGDDVITVAHRIPCLMSLKCLYDEHELAQLFWEVSVVIAVLQRPRRRLQECRWLVCKAHGAGLRGASQPDSWSPKNTGVLNDYVPFQTVNNEKNLFVFWYVARDAVTGAYTQTFSHSPSLGPTLSWGP